ncbi:nucleoside monophosphate kinase [Patescibacteria group bacterium]|nr:nucleoside monophosphate kinase [Patescibacteria group bacterium]
MIISFIGPSGCGKGTQSKILVEKDNFVSISGGAILREEYRKNTDIGVELFNKYWKKGLWVPDDIIFKFIIKKFNDTESNNVILDAYPRTLLQASLMDDYLANIGKKVDLVFIFNLSLDISKTRIIDREKIEKRIDVQDSAIKNRLISYTENIGKIRKYYKNKIVDIDANSSIETIHNFIKKKINEDKE